MSGARLTSCQGKAALVLTAVFIAGTLAGGLGMRAYERSQAANPAVFPVPVVMGPERAVAELERELDLTPAQIDKVKGVLDQCIMQEADLLTQVRGVQAEGRSRILEVLTPDQRAKFETLVYSVARR